jgi:hypothetical protein
MHPSKASCFPKVKFGIIALLILHHIVESTTLGCDSINGWEADEPCGNRPQPEAFSYVRTSTATQLQGDSLRRQTQLSEQYSAERGLDLDEDDIGASAFEGSNIVPICRALAAGQQTRPLSAVPVAIARGDGVPPSAQIARISFSSPAHSIGPIGRAGSPLKIIRLEGEL